MRELKKIIPEHVKRYRVLWLKQNFTTMSERYRRIRLDCGGSMLDCFWCEKKFKDGEKIALASLQSINGKIGGNKTLCQSCAGLVEEI